jgi:hypothetical protein
LLTVWSMFINMTLLDLALLPSSRQAETSYISNVSYKRRTVRIKLFVYCSLSDAERCLKSSRLSTFECWSWSFVWCTRENCSLLAVTFFSYLVPRVFRIHVIPCPQGFYDWYGSIQPNTRAGSPRNQLGTRDANRLDKLLVLLTKHHALKRILTRTSERSWMDDGSQLILFRRGLCCISERGTKSWSTHSLRI